MVVVVMIVASGCQHFYTRRDLDVSVALHHIDLRWGRLENAAQRVDPALRAAFLAEWSARTHTVELQDLEVTGVIVGEDGDTATVVVTFTYVEVGTMQVQRVAVHETWIRTGDGWLAKKPASLDAQSPTDAGKDASTHDDAAKPTPDMRLDADGNETIR